MGGIFATHKTERIDESPYELTTKEQKANELEIHRKMQGPAEVRPCLSVVGRVIIWV